MPVEDRDLWSLSDKKKPTAKRLSKSSSFPTTERDLKRFLICQPDALLKGLKIWASEMPIEGGSGKLDLLGVDDAGRLSLIELKKNAPGRQSVGQLLYYAAALENMGIEDLVNLLSGHRGGEDMPGVKRREDFAEWYRNQPFDQGIESACPVRLFLVGVGADLQTDITIQFLADRGIDISLISIDVYDNSPELIIARQVVAEPPPIPLTTNERRIKETALRDIDDMEKLRGNIERKMEGWPDLRDLWPAGRKLFEDSFTIDNELQCRLRGDRRAKSYPSSQWAWADYRLNFQLFNLTHTAAAIEVDPFEPVFRVIFHAVYVNMCQDVFKELAEKITDYETWAVEKPHQNLRFPNKDGIVPEMKFRIKSKSEFDAYADDFSRAAGCIFERTKERVDRSDPPRSDELRRQDDTPEDLPTDDVGTEE